MKYRCLLKEVRQKCSVITFTNLVDCRFACKYPNQRRIFKLAINEQFLSRLALSSVKYDFSLLRA